MYSLVFALDVRFASTVSIAGAVTNVLMVLITTVGYHIHQSSLVLQDIS